MRRSTDVRGGAERERRPWRAKAARLAFATLTGAGLLLLVEFACRMLGWGTPSPFDDPARGFLPIGRLFTARTDERGEVVLDVDGAMSTTPAGIRRQFNPLNVPARKRPGETRIVCVGGSMTYGWPWDDRSSYPRLLEAGLRAMAPERDVRVINLGAPGWGTTRIALIADEIAVLEPDAVVVTCGNNEALETAFAREVFRLGRGSVATVHALCRHSFLANAVMRAVRPRPTPTPESVMAPALFALDDAMRAELVERFRENLRRIAERLASSGARVYLSADPDNERDCPPMCRDAPGDSAGRQDPALAADFAAARDSLRPRGFDKAVRLLESCRRSDPKSAQIAYLYACALQGAGRADDARRAFRDAVNLDAIALRTFSALTDVVTGVASSTGARVIDFAAAMRAAAPDGIPGDDLFLDNCHPNEAGTRALAQAVARAIAADGVITVDAQAWARFDDGVRLHQSSVRWTAAEEVAAMKYLLGYYRATNPAPERAAGIQRRIEILDPQHALADDEFRKGFFR